jgi:hypothetical protein
MLKTVRSQLLTGLILAVAAAGVGIVLVWGYHDPGVRWAAVGGILAGAAFLVAVIGVYIALTQLADVQRDLDRLTKATDAEKQLRAQLVEGSRFLSSMPPGIRRQSAAAGEFVTWSDTVATFIRAHTDEAEENLFRSAGADAMAGDELKAKIAFMRDDLMPKIRDGYWAL